MSDPHRPTISGRLDGGGNEPGLAEIASVSVEGLIDAVETAGTGRERRRRWALPLRIAVSLLMLGVLWWKFPEIDWGDLIPTWSSDTILWLLAATAMTFLGIVLSAIRWQAVLRALGLRERLRMLIPLYFAGAKALLGGQ
jgi:uncharacterized membrane protein YbhN (UPF0104 family)